MSIFGDIASGLDLASSISRAVGEFSRGNRSGTGTGRITISPTPQPALPTTVRGSSVVPIPIAQPRGPISGRSAYTANVVGGQIMPAALGPIVRGGASAAGGALAIEGFRSFFGGNGEKISDILAEARENTGRTVTSKKIRDAARHCGLEIAADMFGLDPLQVCRVVTETRSRRSRGISAADMRRTRSTIRKINSMHKNLATLARTAPRRR